MPPPDKLRDVLCTLNDPRGVTRVVLFVRIKKHDGSIVERNIGNMPRITDGVYRRQNVNVKKDADDDQKVYIRAQVHFTVGGVAKSYFLDGRSPDHV